MKLSIRTQHVIIELISMLYTLLFTYAAASKLLDFEQFRLQLGQSPLLSVFADWLVWGVPMLELLIVFLLVNRRLRFIGLFASFSLMVSFTTYIVIILNYSAFVPCSCGGILEKMGWTEHLIFNICFIVLALTSLILSQQQAGLVSDLSKNKKKNPLLFFKIQKAFIISLVGCFLFSVLTVFVLYGISEEVVHRNNSFLRRYPHHPISQLHGLSLTYNSYYIAGFSGNRIYLGNVTAPLQLFSIDTSFKNVQHIRIHLLGRHDYAFSSVQVRIKAPYFFLTDRTIPIIYRGNLFDWTAKPVVKGDVYFSLIEPMDFNSFVVRSRNGFSGEHILGILKVTDSIRLKPAPHLLQKQFDGVFDTDGILSYNSYLKQLIYVYYYRNAFIVVDRNLKSVFRGKTIDTVSRAAIHLTYLRSKGEKKLATQPPMIQQYSTSAGKYLFVKSNRLGRYEPESMLANASIIDVYDLQKQSYEFSFYLYDYENEKVRSFSVYGNLLVGLTEHYIVAYRLKTHYFGIMPID